LTALKPSKSKRMRGGAALVGGAEQGVVEAAAVVEARQGVALGHAALHRLSREQTVLEVVHRDAACPATATRKSTPRAG
jgi:hypothetical protein